MLKAGAGTTVSRNDTAVAPFSRRSSIKGSPHNEPIQKPKLTSTIAVRAAAKAMRS